MDLYLNNKRTLITGVSRGIELAIAESFLQEDARACLVSRGSNALFENEKRLQDAYGLESVIAPGNVYFEGGSWDEKNSTR